MTLMEDRPHNWLVAVEAARMQAFLLTDASEDVFWNGITWQSWPMQIGDHRDNGEGDLASTTLALSNVARVAMPYLEADDWGSRGASRLSRCSRPMLPSRLAFASTT